MTRKTASLPASRADAPRRGRPVVLDDAQRRDRILDALELVYREGGLEGATMDAVAARAGMSKRTLYAVFSSRSRMLRAYLERQAGALVRPLTEPDRDLPLPDRLRLLLLPDASGDGHSLPLEILRLTIIETASNPAIGRELLARITEPNRRLVTEELRRADARGELAVDDAREAADLLLDMMRPGLLEVLLDPVSLPHDTVLEHRFALAMRVLSAAYPCRVAACPGQN